MHHKELHTIFTLHQILSNVAYTRLAEHVAHIAKKNSKETLGRLRRREENNIKMDLKVEHHFNYSSTGPK